MHVEEQKSVKYLYVAGSCYPRQAYIADYNPISMPTDEKVRRKVEYVFDSLRIKDENSIYGPGKKTMRLEYLKDTEDGKEDLKTQRKLVVGSCKLLDNKMEKPTNFEVILPVTTNSFRKTITSHAIISRALPPQEPKASSRLHTSLTRPIHFS